MDYERVSPLKIRKEIIDECFNKANSRPNLAVQLVSVLQKRERHVKLFWKSSLWEEEAVPEQNAGSEEGVYTYHPVLPSEKEETVWKAFRIAIDSSCRQLNRPKKAHSCMF